MGLAAANFTDKLLSPKNLANLQDVLDNMARLLPSFGNIAGNVYSSLLTIIKAADPLTRRFVGYLEKQSETFSNFLDTKAASGELEKFFNRSGELAADFGKVFGNSFNFLGDIIKANFGTVGGGQYMLNWLKGATKKWAELSENMGKANLQGYFLGASKNSKAILQSVGSLVSEIGKLADMPEIKKTFDTLALGAPYLGSMLREGAKAGPILADLIVQITKIASIFADSGQINVYFGTLRNVAKFAADALNNETFKSLVNIVTQISGVALAVGTLHKAFSFGFKIIAGVILGPYNMIKGLPGAFTTATTAVGKFGVVLKGAFGVVGIIGAVVAGVIALNDQLEQAKKDSVTSGEKIRNAFLSGKSGVDVMKEALKDTGGNIMYVKREISGMIGDTPIVHLNTYITSMDDLATSGDKMKLVLAALSKENTGFGKSIGGTQDWFDKESDWTKVETAIGNTGSALAQLAGSSIPDASSKFLELTKAYQMTDADARRFLEAMPELKTQLAETARNAGMATDDTTLLNIAMQRGGDYSNIMASGLGGVDTAADNASKKVQWLSDKILGFGKTNLDTRDAVRRFEAAVDSVTESVKTNGKNLDITTAAGRSNQSALDDLARSAVNQATAIYKATGNTDELTKSMDKGRESLVKAAEKMGLTKDKAKTLADTLLGTPKDIQISVDANTGKATEKLESIKKNYGKGSGFWDNIFGWLTGPKKKDGGFVGFANGGYVKRLAPGGYVSGAGTSRSDSIPAMLSNGEYIINARATSENRELLDRINNNQSVKTAPTINMVINPSPGMDERSLAEMVSRRIAFEIRKGTI
jgi:phage-related minor tail protein